MLRWWRFILSHEYVLWLARKLTIRGKNAPGRNGEKILWQAPSIAPIHSSNDLRYRDMYRH